MQQILIRFSEGLHRRIAWLFSLLLIAFISAVMLMGSGDSSEVDMILSIDPMFLLIIQGLTSIFIFVGIPSLFIRVVLKISVLEFIPKISWMSVSLTFLISICFIVVISAVGEWNMNLDFGDTDFAKWAKISEAKRKALTEYLTEFTSTGHFLLALFVVAIVPGIGEELLFRGLIQNNLSIAIKNHHISIWLTGFIFAAIHLQFFGFAPRMLLGVLFGYLYCWSGKLSIAMLAHTINNGLAIIVLFLAQRGAINISPEEMEKAAPLPVVMIFGALGLYLLVVFKRKFSRAYE